MRFATVLSQATGSILRNKGRSFLTTLGIVIGIGAVIALMAIGAGVQLQIDAQIAKLGTTTLTIRSQNPRQMGMGQRRGFRPPFGGPGGGPFRSGGTSTLTIADYETIRNAKGIVAASPQMMSVAEISCGANADDAITGSVTGVSAEYFQIQKLAIAQGSPFTEADIKGASPVAIIGSDAARDVFSASPGQPRESSSPDGLAGAPLPACVGKPISLNGITYTVRGVLQKADTAAFFNGPNDAVFIPYTTAQKQFNRHKFASITASAISSDAVAAAQADITTRLLAAHKIADAKSADFSIITAQELLKTTSTITGMITSMLAGIASISLLVGGIGIMNVMLVTVTERTREIGLRRAVGAKSSHIIVQFLTESVILTVIGGIFGIVTGFALSRIAGKVINIQPAVTTSAVLLALGVSSLVGIVFGLFPAIKAARLDPVDALRYE